MVSNRSNGIYRSVITAAVGLALVGAGKPPTKAVETKSDQATNTVNKDKTVGADLTVPEQPTSPRPDEGCERGKDDRKSDLCAQWKAADAAADAAQAAWLQFWAGIVGLALGAITMFAAIAAALYARRAAVATEQTVNIAQEAAKGADSALSIANRNADAAVRLADQSEASSKRQLRAYLSVKSFVLDATEWDDDEFVFNMEITNNGTTPAIITKMVCKVVWTYKGGDGHEIISFDTPIKTKVDRDTPINIPLNFKGSFEGCQEPGHIFVYGRIDYDDVFWDGQKDTFSFRTAPSEYCAFYDHDLPCRLSVFPLESILERIEENEAAKKGRRKKGKAKR